MAITTKKAAAGARPAGAKTPAAKTGGAKAGKVVAGPAAAKDSAPAAVAKEPAPAVAQLRLKDLLGRVTATTGAKPRDVRGIVAATLAEIGQALARGEGLNLPELGRARVTRRSGDVEAGHTLVVKLRQAGAAGAKAGKEPLAEGDD